jgi:hypothetical protein
MNESTLCLIVAIHAQRMRHPAWSVQAVVMWSIANMSVLTYSEHREPQGQTVDLAAR